MPTLSNRDYLLLRAYQAGITDSRELAAFMGQMEVESGQFGSMHERLGYRGRRLLDVFEGRNGVDTLEEANTIARGGPEAVANAVYGGRWGRNNLGNTEPGDGWRFHGRGYIQFTGRDNYERATRELDINLIQNPDLAADREIAADIAMNYWSNRVVARNHQFDVREATHDINGGYTHLAERTAAIGRWEQALTLAVMEGLSRGEILLPAIPGQQNALADGILKLGEKGPEVRDLQERLVKLGITNAKGEALVPDGNYGKSTKEAVAKFQNQHWFHISGAAGGAYVSGIANQETLKAIQDRVNALDPLHGVRHAGDQFLPPGYRTDWLQIDAQGLPSYLLMDNAQNRTHTREQVPTPAQAPEMKRAQTHEHQRTDASVTDPAQARLAELQREMDALRRQVQHDNPSPHNGPAPRHEADLHTGARSAAMSAPGRNRPEREPESDSPQPHLQHDAQVFPTGHRDYALFEAIRRQLPDEYSDDMAAHATLEAKRGGITRPDQIKGMAIENGQLTVMGKSGMDFAFVELTASAPPLPETLQQSAAFDRQQAMQLAQFQEQQQQMNMGRGPSMTL